MTVATKICGVSTPEAVDAAISGGASHLGFVFYPPSPRHLAFDRALALVAQVPQHIGKVGVFVDPDDGLLDAARATGLTSLQLHRVTPKRAAVIRASSTLDTWIALAVQTRSDLQEGAQYRGVADRLVYDAKTPEGALPGGMGLRFDWRLLAGFDHPLPWMLSGGLDAANLAEAVGVTGARLVDVSSGVESAPGVKDVDKIAAFLHAARQL